MVSLAVLAGVVSPCAAAEPSSADARLYGAVGVVGSRLKPDTEAPPSLSVRDDSDAGYSLALGYRLRPRLAFEGHLTDPGTARLAPVGEVDYLLGGFSALWYGIGRETLSQYRHGLALFGRLGVGVMDNQSNVRVQREHDAHLLGGLGLEYGFGNGIGVRAEIVSHDQDARYAGLALLYHFGGAKRAAPPSSADTLQIEEAPDVSESADAEPARAASTTSEPIVREPVDSDVDGVPDVRDDCPDTPADRPVDDAGCDVIFALGNGVHFLFDSDQLTVPAARVVARLAEVLLANPSLRVAVEAHTDNTGDAFSNLRLASMRALTVAGYLVRGGVDAGRLQLRAYGESLPVESNATAKGRARNRRVEFLVLD